MNSTSKRFSRAAVCILCVFAIALCAVSVATGSGVASAAEANGRYTYFYEELSELSKQFYNVIAELEASGDLKDGLVSYNLVENGIVTAAQVENYVTKGDSSVPVAFSAARDAYLLDNPSLFYIDLYKLVFSAGKKNNNWVALIDTGNYDNCYFDGGFKNETEVNQAIAQYNTALDNAVAYANQNGVTDNEKVAAVNAYIIDNLNYDYAAYNTYIEETENNAATSAEDNLSVALAYSSSAYGGLVNGLAVCSGYSKTFKVIMDKLEIPCVCVQGYSRRPGNDSAEPHMWNYVKLDDNWYAVDTTWNDTGSSSKARAQASATSLLAMRYLLVGNNKFAVDHNPDGVISSSGFELYYPKLSNYDYGTTEDENGFAISTTYVPLTDEVTFLRITASYKGMGAAKLEEQGLYMVFRYDFQDRYTHEWTTDYWNQFTKYQQYYDSLLEIEDTYVTLTCTTEMTNIQFAIFNKESDGMTHGTMYSSYIYDPANLNTTEVLVDYNSKPIINEKYGTYKAPAYPIGFTPANTEIQDHGTYNMKIVYDDPLKIVDPEKPVGVRLSTVYNDMEGKYTLKDVVFNEKENSLSFTFTPSMMYHHNQAYYNFFPTNLVSEDGEKIPVGAGWCFEYPVPCYKGFVSCQNTNHFAQVYGQPQLISDENLAEAGFESVLGQSHKYDTDQRAQILLVVTKPGAEQTQNMQDMFAEETGASTTDVKTTATYEIGMDVCGGACKQVPDGWKLQIGVGFPYKDFDYTDTSTVYKAYHYKRDADGTVISIEEISCIVTPLGLVIDVDSFSPFMIVALDANSELAKTATKQIFANKLTGNGKILEQESGKNNIFQVKGSITYDLIPENGYAIEKVLLNGEPISASRYESNTLTLSESELNANNTLDVYFVSEAAIARYEEANIEVESPAVIEIKDESVLKANASAHQDAYVPENQEINFVTDYAPTQSGSNNPGSNQPGNNVNLEGGGGQNSNVGLIVGCVVGAVAAIAIIVVVAIVIAKKRKTPKRV